MALVDKVTALSKQWDVKNTSALLLQPMEALLGVMIVIGVATNAQYHDSVKQDLYAIFCVMSLVPAINLFMDLLAAGVYLLHLHAWIGFHLSLSIIELR